MFYKSDFQVFLDSDTGWGSVPFRLNFYTSSPTRGFVACFDGETFHNCHLHEDGRLCIAFDNHKLGIGSLMAQPTFYLNNECYASGICDEAIPAFPVTVKNEQQEDCEIFLSVKGAKTIVTYGTLPAFFQIGPQGNPGKDFTYDDFTPEQIAGLQKPALDAAKVAEDAAKEAQKSGDSASNAASFAENVNAIMDGDEIVVTDRNGVTIRRNVKGRQGEKGNDGRTPIKGVDYFDGRDGINGKDGVDGKDGKDYVITQSDYNAIADIVSANFIDVELNAE